MKPPRLSIIGATGIVGKTTLDVLTEWNVPVAKLKLFSSAGSSGNKIKFRGEDHVVKQLKVVPDDTDIAIFATSSKLSEKWVPEFQKAGITVIDHSSRFRMRKDVPLVIPEINAHALKNHGGLISNPNCSASVMLLPLFGLHRTFGLSQIVASTYQSVSGAGRAAIEEFEAQRTDNTHVHAVFPVRIEGNVIPQIGTFNDAGISGEEEKVGDEIRKILEDPGIHVLCTTVRVPVLVGHAASVTVRLKKSASLDEIHEAISSVPGLLLERDKYKTPFEIAGKLEVFVSRIRQDKERPDWVQFWVVGDNLRKGAASNAVQILQELCA